MSNCRAQPKLYNTRSSTVVNPAIRVQNLKFLQLKNSLKTWKSISFEILCTRDESLLFILYAQNNNLYKNDNSVQEPQRID